MKESYNLNSEFLDSHSGQPIVFEYQMLAVEANVHRHQADYYENEASKILSQAERLSCPRLMEEAAENSRQAASHFLQAKRAKDESSACQILISEADDLMWLKGRRDNGN